MKARALWVLGLLLVGPAIAYSAAEETPEALMTKGLDALYVKSDPEGAVKTFRQVLAKNPEHYGANYQLAVALDRAGKPAEAVPQWEKALAMAEAIKDEKTAATARERLSRAKPGPEDAAMKAGLDALYDKKDAAAAIVEFRKVLEMNPNHYGANLQLAKALDQAGKPAEAQPRWEKALAMAEAAKDEKTADTARERLGRPKPSPEDAGMKAGVDALYEKKDAAAAIVEFRKVLEMNPNHYGANFQLAKALDQAGKPAEARPQWEKILKMAEGIKDAKTAETARERLARKP